MAWEPSDAWRNSYDAWKLATPLEYEMSAEEEDRCERRSAEDRIDELTQEDETPEIAAEIARLREFLTTEPCPNCNVEWADQHLGECDICHGARRVRKYDPAGIPTIPSDHGDASQDMIGAVLGTEADDDVETLEGRT